jgi:hypothetical protein
MSSYDDVAREMTTSVCSRGVQLNLVILAALSCDATCDLNDLASTKKAPDFERCRLISPVVARLIRSAFPGHEERGRADK